MDIPSSRAPHRTCATVLVLLMLLLVVPPRGAAQELRFVAEDITLSVAGDSCHIDGTYRFANYGAQHIVTTLRYPFPESDRLGAVVSFGIIDVTSGLSVEHTVDVGAMLFPISVPPGQVRSYRIRYWQHTPHRTMTYLLTTTRHWNAPLEEARFTLAIPDSYQLLNSSYAVGKPEQKGSTSIYRFARRQFVPAHDLRIAWKDNPP